MELFNGQLAAMEEELGIGHDALMKMCTRDKSLRLRRACKGTPALFAVDRLPLKYRQQVYMQNPTLTTANRESESFLDKLVPDGAALCYFRDLLLDGDRHLPEDKQRELANNAAILNALGDLIDKAQGLRTKQDGKRLNKGEFWQRAAEVLPNIADKWPHSLPRNCRELQRKFNSYKSEGYDALVSGKYGTVNRAKVATDEQKGVITSLLAHHNNLDNAQIARAYNLAAEKNGWATISAATVANWRTKTDLICSAGRLGESNYRNTKEMQVQRSRPSAPFLFWTMDGWDAELLYQRTDTDSKGHNRTTYHNRLTLEVVLDASCDYIMGYAIGYEESQALQLEAIKNAVEHGKELAGEMLMTMQIQSDHFGLTQKVMPIYAAIADKITPARVKNAKAKVVEPFFRYLQKTYCQTLDNWAGFGVTSNRLAQPNSEALNKHKKDFPDEAGVRAQLDAIVETDRARKRPQILEKLANLKAEHRRPVSRENWLLYFGTTSDYTYQLGRSGIQPKLLGERRQYDCFDINFRMHKGTEWTLKYDLNDLSTVLAVSPDGEYRYLLEQKYVQPMALADREEGDAEQLQRVRNFNKQLEEHVANTLGEANENARTAVASAPELGNILNRLLITDSKGQHKKERNALRLGKAVKTAIEAQQTTDTTDYSIF